MRKVWLAVSIIMFCISAFGFELPDKINSPEMLALYLANFRYIEDPGEYFKSPEETFNDVGGDCEDFGIFVRECLRRMGIESTLYGIFSEKADAGHVICIYKDRCENYRMFSNNMLSIFKSEYLIPFILAHYPETDFICELEVTENDYGDRSEIGNANLVKKIIYERKKIDSSETKFLFCK